MASGIRSASGQGLLQKTADLHIAPVGRCVAVLANHPQVGAATVFGD